MASSAHALLQIIQRYGESDKNCVDTWAEIFGVGYEAPEYAFRHSEVIRIFSDTLIEVEAVDDEAYREDLRALFSSLWKILVNPGRAWNDGANGPALVDAGILKELRAYVYSTRGTKEQSGIEATICEKLRTQAQEWIQELSEPISDVADEFRVQLRQQFAHIVWLVDNVSIFGVGRVESETQAVAGKIASSNLVRQSKWEKRAIVLLLTLNLFSSAADKAADGMENTNRIIEGLKEAYSLVAAPNPPAQLPSKPNDAAP